MNDDVLRHCNETELLWMARRQGLGHLRRGLPRDVLLEIVTGRMNPLPEHYSGTAQSRAMLEAFIARNWGQLRSQLPGCNGKCRSYPCSDGQHAMCFHPNADLVHSYR